MPRSPAGCHAVHVRSLRAAVLLAAGLVLPVSLLSACTGSDEPAEVRDTGTTSPTTASTDASTEPTSSSAPTESDPPTSGDEPAFPLISGDPCTTTVKVTGAVEETWDAEGDVALSESGPTATYQTHDGATVLTAYAEGNGFQETFILSVGLDTYAPAPGSGELEISDDGTDATIDADAVGASDASVHVIARIAC